MNIEEGKERGVTSGNLSSSPFATTYSSAPPPPPQFYAHADQAGPVYEGRPTIRGQDPLPCGCGFGWLLFILGFFLGVIPWYVGAIMLLCAKDYDNREKPGLIACAIFAVLATIVIIVVVVVN